MLKRDIVRSLDHLSPENLKEVQEFIESLRRSQSAFSLFEKIDEHIRSVPEGDWEKVPADGSKRLDEYLYGPSDA